MGMHKHSENMNDPSCLSAVLQMYEMLRLHDWEKLRSSTASYLTYKTGSSLSMSIFSIWPLSDQYGVASIAGFEY